MKICLLVLQVGDFGIDGDNGIGELEQVGEGVDKSVLANDDFPAGSGFIPAVAVTAEEDGSAGGVVECVVFR